MRHRRATALSTVLLIAMLTAGCSGAAGTRETRIPTNGSPVMIELYTDW